MEVGRYFNVWVGFDSFSVLCGFFFLSSSMLCGGFCCFFLLLLLLLNKNDNILSVSFRGGLFFCFTAEMPLSSVDYLVNMLQGLFYTGLNTTEVTEGFFFVCVNEFLGFLQNFPAIESLKRNIAITKCRHGKVKFSAFPSH